ncbi:hypothetical protein JOQ06_030450 [Pogonophryne albipinna]|uniref:Uncharacterized protein n=1 Tax=Pogonophryne albipinna TaxID=1090488 RepID=A0AAD6FG63_9TELE|nr:hypothetical protein JOQ06_030450 [Pogonophryne albipinna]
MLQEPLLELSSDRGLKMAYAEKSLTEFWCDVEKEYPELGKHALIELLPFGSIYLSVSTLPPELSKLMKDKQAQVSH